MEKVNSKSFIFRFVLSCFLIIFALSVYFDFVYIPSLPEVADAILSPFERINDPLTDLSDSFAALDDFISSGSLPTLENLLNLFTAPFKLVGSIVVCFGDILAKIIALFRG